MFLRFVLLCCLIRKNQKQKPFSVETLNLQWPLGSLTYISLHDPRITAVVSNYSNSAFLCIFNQSLLPSVRLFGFLNYGNCFSYRNEHLRPIHTMRLQLRFAYRNKQVAWDQVSLLLSPHVNNYIESHTSHLL